MTGEAWMEQANCRGLAADLFFPARGDATAQARGVCAGCAVRDQCLDYALTNRVQFGIWGGLSERQRRRIRRSAARAEAS